MKTSTTKLARAFVATASIAAVTAMAPACDSNSVSFNGNSPDCPAIMPAQSAACGDDGLTCQYPDDCTGGTWEMTCNDNGWAVTDSPPTCNPPPPNCPSTKPDDGNACSDIGLECNYVDICSIPVTSTCTDNGWSTPAVTCNPPPPECPQELPTAGASCEEDPNGGGYAFGCGYPVETPCGATNATADCLYDSATGEASWQVALDEPCTSGDAKCFGYSDESLCAADTECQWLVPASCPSPDGIVAPVGCYPTQDCSATGCGDWGTCEQLQTDPCYNSNCDACMSEISVCTSPNDG